METDVDEIAPGIFRLSTWSDLVQPAIAAEEIAPGQ
jgi:hypothetical protein